MRLHFRYTMLGFLGAVLLTSLFVGLGKWQLDRAAEKAAIRDNYRQHSQAPAVALPDRLADAAQWRHRKVSVTARPLPTQQFLLDNRIHKGRAGFNVLTPFITASGKVLLVDRGWVPLGSTRNELPDVAIADEMMTLEGLVYVPYAESFSLGGMDDGELGWPRIIQFIDFNTLGQRLTMPLRPFTLRLDPSQPHGYLREWHVAAVSPDKHLAYAFQWFALALTVVIGFVLVTLRRKKQ